MLIYCTKPEHKRIERMVPSELDRKRLIKAIVEDPSTMCFRNSDGSHIAPRRCVCMKFTAPKEDRQVSRWKNHEKFGFLEARLDRDKNDKIIQKTIPVGMFREFMMEIHGKQNPACPIEAAHLPIDPNTATQ